MLGLSCKSRHVAKHLFADALATTRKTTLAPESHHMIHRQPDTDFFADSVVVVARYQ